MGRNLSFLGNKEGFNLAVRHCKKVVEYLSSLGKNSNFADIVNFSLDNGDITSDQINSIIGTLVVDKFGFNYKSFNLSKRIENFENIVSETKKWTGIDIVVSYYHPKLKQCVINPKVQEQWERVGDFSKDEIVVIYAKTIGSVEDDKDKSSKAVNTLIDMFNGIIPSKTDNDFISKGSTTIASPPKTEPVPQVAQTKPKVASGKIQMSGKVAVQVTNELFHNGNVEAWKNVIESYNSKYPNLEVVVFYDNEVINNLNSLFKWGKVKIGSVILFQVIGQDFKDVSKLKRYLYEGASSRYENFLDKDVNKVLNLF